MSERKPTPSSNPPPHSKFQAAVTAKFHLGSTRDSLALNAGCNPTCQLYDQGAYPFKPVGFCLLEATDLDLPNPFDRSPNSYIAAPALKCLE